MIKNSSGDVVKEMNEAPHPWFDAKVNWRYFDSNPRGQKFPHLQIWSSRGCPYKCIFCVWPATMTGNDQPGFEAVSFANFGLLTMAFLPVSVGSGTIYAPIQSVQG